MDSLKNTIPSDHKFNSNAIMVIQDGFFFTHIKNIFLARMAKNFSSPKIKIWFEPMFFFGLFCGFERCGSAAFSNLRGGIFSEKCVRTNSKILRQKGNCKEFLRPRKESNPHQRLRRALLYPLSYGGKKIIS